MNLDLYDKFGNRITYVVLKPDFKMGSDIQIGECIFKMGSDGKYKTQDDPLMMLCGE